MSTRTNHYQQLVVFIAAFALPMILLTAQPSAAAVRTVAGRGGGCLEEPSYFTCLGVAGTDFQIGNLAHAVFHLYTGEPMTVDLILSKQSSTGSVSADTRTISYGAGFVLRATTVTAINILSTPSTSDYLYSRIRRTTGSNGPTFSITPMGIRYVTN